MITISFPDRLERDTLSAFFDELGRYQNSDEVCIDFSTLRYSYPTAMLVAGSKIRTWVTHRRDNKLSTRQKGVDSNHDVHSYLSHLGFFDYILMRGGNPIGTATGSTHYLPITKIEKPAFDSKTQETQEWFDQIIGSVRGLARVVSGTVEDTEENRLYNYSLREIIRNVFEHSEATECYVCGQRWYDGKVEIAVVDEGIGISNSLRSAHQIDEDSSALRMAIKPGISRTSFIDDDKNTYDNSGFGLYILSQLASNFGWYVLGSGSSRIVGYKKELVDEELNFSGTYFGMQLQRPPAQFSSLLSDIIAAGEQEAEVSGISKKASGMSKLA